MEKKVVNQSNIRRSNPIAMLKKNAMLIILVLVYIFFPIMTKGRMFKPTSFASLINQNAYVYILGCGMLMCMLTGGNIDLSCGAFVCLLGALGGMMMVVWKWGTAPRRWPVTWLSVAWAPPYWASPQRTPSPSRIARIS